MTVLITSDASVLTGVFTVKQFVINTTVTVSYNTAQQLKVTTLEFQTHPTIKRSPVFWTFSSRFQQTSTD